MRTKDYITATHEILNKNQDTKSVLASLKKYLESRGLMQVYPNVLRGLIEKSERAAKREGVRVSVAREGDIQKYKSAIEAHLEKHNLPSEYTTTIDETIVGGYIITTKGERINQSYKHKLLTAYRALID